MASIEKIDNLVTERKTQLTSKVLWSIPFKQALTTWPDYNNLGATPNQGKICDGCNLANAKSHVQMAGHAYSSSTLRQLKLDQNENVSKSFNLCQKCNNLSQLFHRLVHQKHWMSKLCSEAVTSLKKDSPRIETAAILNYFLDDEEWLEQQFKKVQDLWANVDALK